MSDDNKTDTLQTLLDLAAFIESGIDAAMDDNDDDRVDALSLKFTDTLDKILSYSSQTLADLNRKCGFFQKLILADLNDPDLVRRVFTNLKNDIENLQAIYAV